MQAGPLQPSVAAALGVSSFTFTPVSLSEVRDHLIWNGVQGIQIMVGLLSTGLGRRQTFDLPADSTGVGAAFWLGVVVNDMC